MSDPKTPDPAKDADGNKKEERKDPKTMSAAEAAEEVTRAEQRMQQEGDKLLESEDKVVKVQAMVARSLAGGSSTAGDRGEDDADNTETADVRGFDTQGEVVDADNEEQEDDDNDLYGFGGLFGQGAVGGDVNVAPQGTATAPLGAVAAPPGAAAAQQRINTGALSKKAKSTVSGIRATNSANRSGKVKPLYGGYFAEIEGWSETPTGNNIKSLAEASGIDMTEERVELIRNWVRQTLVSQRDHGYDISKDVMNVGNVFDVKKYLEKYDTNPEVDPNLRELKERAVYTILSGLLLFMARFDMTTLATVPVTDKRLVTYILANLLPRMITADPLSVDNIGEQGLDQLIFNMASKDMPLDVLVAMHTALSNRVADIINDVKKMQLDPQTRDRFISEITRYVGASSNVFGRLQIAMEVANSNNAFAFDTTSDYLRIIQDVAVRAMPEKANEIMTSVHDMLSLMYSKNIMINQKDMQQMVDITGKLHALNMPYLEKTLPPPGRSLSDRPMPKTWKDDPVRGSQGNRTVLEQPHKLPSPPPPTPPFTYPSSFPGTHSAEKEVRDIVDKMRKYKEGNAHETQRFNAGDVPSMLRGASIATPSAGQVFSSTHAAGASPAGNITMGDSLVNMSAIKQPSPGAPFAPQPSPAEVADAYYKDVRKDPTIYDMVKSYRGRPPAGGFGVDTQALRDEIKLPDLGVFGSNLDRELSLTSNRKGGDNLGVFSKAAGAAIQNSFKAKELADQLDVSKVTPNQALSSMAQQIKYLSAAVAPENLRAMFSKDGMTSSALKLHRRYEVVPVPPLGTENFRISDRKDVLALVGNSTWSGIGVRGTDTKHSDQIDSFEFFSAVYSVIENKLNAVGAINLLKTVGSGEFGRAVRDFSSGVSFPHLWRQLTVWFKTTTDFPALERRKIDLKSKRPKNISNYTRSIIYINHMLSMELPEGARKKYEIDINRKDLLHVVYTYFPSLVEEIVGPEYRDFQEWADRRQTARMAGLDPDLMPSSYHPYFELSHSIVTHVELVYGASVMQREDVVPAVVTGKPVGQISAIDEESNADASSGPQIAEISDTSGVSDVNPEVAATEVNFSSTTGLKTNLACSLCRCIGHIHRDCKLYPGSTPSASLCRYCRGAHPGFCKDPSAPPREKQ